MIKLGASLAWFAFATGLQGQAFGRFGFSTFFDLPAMVVNSKGVIAKNPMADQLRFPTELKTWKALATTDIAQTVACQEQPGCPNRLVANLLSPGVAMQFSSGFSFQTSSNLAPYVSWDIGSCGAGVPTPPVNWILVSFHDAQPPVLIKLGGQAKTAFEVTGQSGAWRISTPDPYKGWLRIGYPLGREGRATRSAADLGRLVKEITPDLPLWADAPAGIKKLDIKSDEFGLNVTYDFGGPALVPPPIILAPLGSYPLKLGSTLNKSQFRTEFGSGYWTPDGILKVRYPVREVPPGRAIAFAQPSRALPGTVSYIDPPSIVDLAIEAIRGDRDPATIAQADELEQHFLEETKGTLEPITQQQVLYDAANRGMGVLAAHAFVNAVVSAGTASTPDTALFTTALWRRDWWSFLPTSADKVEEADRKSASMLAVSGALFGTEDARYQGALFEAGLAADRAKHLDSDRSKCVDVLSGLRASLFADTRCGKEENQVLSRVRVISGQAIWASADGDAYLLHFPAHTESERIVLWLPADCKIEAGPNARLTSVTRNGAIADLQVATKPSSEAAIRIYGLALTKFPGATKLIGPPDLTGYRELYQ